MSYPAGYDDILPVSSGELIIADYQNQVTSAVNAIETALGLYPYGYGVYTNVADAIAGKLDNLFAEDTSTTINTYKVTLSPVPTTLPAGFLVRFQATNPNTGPASLSINGTTPVTLTKQQGVQLTAGDIKIDQIVEAAYDATNNVFQMLSTPSSTAGINNPQMLVILAQSFL